VFLSKELACALPAKRIPAVNRLPKIIFFIVSHLLFIKFCMIASSCLIYRTR
jgi:hypothetical protein